MQTSLRNVREESRVGRTRSFEDVESLLHRPLLAGLKAGGTQSVAHNGNVEPRCSPQMWRRHSAPCLRVPDADHERPPYKSRDGYSILFKAIFAVAVYFGVGMLSFSSLGNQLFGIKTESFIDVLYFCVVTLTTVGYGDLVPATTEGKVFTCVYTFVGFGLVSALVSGAAHYIVEMQEQILVHAIKRKEQLRIEQSEEDHVQAATRKVLLSGILALALLFLGAIFMMIVERKTLVDAFYCVCVTVTTLGYGDESFHTALGRLFAAIWILSSTASLGQFLLYVAEMRTVRRQQKLANWVLHRRTTRPDLEAADRDGDCVASAPEFVIFKLKELGKINEEDVIEILREFQKLDCDRSGTISMKDLSLAQQC